MKKLDEKHTVSELKKQLLAFKLKTGVGESVKPHLKKELRKSIAVALTIASEKARKGYDSK